MPTNDLLSIERTYDANPSMVWDLWTTAEGIESWWSPDGFVTEVQKLELRPGGELVYTMTATAPEQVEFMRSAGMPLSTVSRKVFIHMSRPNRLAYRSIVDFVPDEPAYEHLTEVEIEPAGDGARVVMTIEPMHDEVWTERLLAGRANELDNLEAVIAGRP